MLFFRQLQHLLPRARAWRTTVDKTLRHFFLGLSELPADVRQFVDDVYLDLFPDSTRELAAWEAQFALTSAGSDATRRQRLAAAWLEEGGQDPDYIQTQLHAAGFGNVYIHEWWESGPPYVARDPRDYVTLPLLGFYQCEATDPWECFDTGPGEPLAPHCDDTLANDPGYLVNLDLTRRAPPPVPSDPAFWPYFLYFGGETFPNPAYVDSDRLDELKAKILQLRPSQQWVVLMVEPLPLMTGLTYRFAVDHLTAYEAGTAEDLRRIESAGNPGSAGGASVQATSAERPVATTFPEGRVAYFGPGASLASSLPASSWTALHNPTGIVTLAVRFRILTSGTGTCVLIGTLSSNAAAAVGMWILEVPGLMALQVGNGGAAQTVTFAPSAGTHTLVMVKDGAQVDVYVDDMATPAGSLSISAGSIASPQETLTIGSPSVSDVGVWVPEVLVFDFAASEAQRDEIATHLASWTLAPTQEQYVAHMVDDGLAHLFTPESIVDADEWTDLVTGTPMALSGGARTVTTLDGVPALLVEDDGVGDFNAAAPLASGTNQPFAVVTYGQLFEEAGPPLWGFFDSVGSDEHIFAVLDGSVQVTRSGANSTAIAENEDDRFYTHVFRASSDTANLFRVESQQNSPALAVATVALDEFRIAGGPIGGAVFAFLALYARALNEGDLQALYQVIDREL